LHPLVKKKFGETTLKPKIVWKPIVEEDRNLRASRLLSALQGKAISVNEFRQAIGFERIEDRPELDEVMPAPKVSPENLSANPFGKPNVSQTPKGQPDESGNPNAPGNITRPPPEGTKKKESSLEQDIRIKKMRLLVGQEGFKDELVGIIKRAQFEYKQGDRLLVDIKKEAMERAKDSIKRNVSNSYLYGKIDTLYNEAAIKGDVLNEDALTITKKDLPDITKMEEKYIKDFEEILTDMFTIKEEV
jgi:hypothetical protein